MGILKATYALLLSGSFLMLLSCNGILKGVYDDPPAEPTHTVEGQLYIDASDWTEWHYIDFEVLAANDSEDFNPSSLWISKPIPLTPVETPFGKSGIYTYWYDVYGAGISVNEFRSYTPTAPQEEPQAWTIAVHRNNVRTNGCAVAATAYDSVDDVPDDREWLESLIYTSDTWNETDVWAVQEKMLLGLIGNQGIGINSVLSSWLSIKIPPIPPSFTLNSKVFIMRLPDNQYAALQLENYQSPKGVKCCLTINYRFPL